MTDKPTPLPKVTADEAVMVAWGNLSGAVESMMARTGCSRETALQSCSRVKR